MSASSEQDGQIQLHELFRLDEDTVGRICGPDFDQQRKIDAFFGDGLLGGCLNEILHERYEKDGWSVGKLNGMKVSYVSNTIMAILLHCGTNALEMAPWLRTRNAHSCGTLFEALLWAARDHVDEVVRDYVVWVDENCRTEVLESAKETRELSWADASGREAIDVDDTFDVARLEVLLAPRLARQIVKREVVRTFDQEYSRSLSGLLPDVDNADGHEWTRDLYDCRNLHVSGRGSADSTWHGQFCRHCGAFLVRRKVWVSNKRGFQEFTLLGRELCPRKPPNAWIEPYTDVVHEKLLCGVEIGERITSGQLHSWGFLTCVFSQVCGPFLLIVTSGLSN